MSTTGTRLLELDAARSADNHIHTSSLSSDSSDDEHVAGGLSPSISARLAATAPARDSCCVLCGCEIAALNCSRLLTTYSRFSRRTLAMCLDQLLAEQLHLPADQLQMDSCVCGSCEQLLHFVDCLYSQLEAVRRRVLVSLHGARVSQTGDPALAVCSELSHNVSVTPVSLQADIAHVQHSSQQKEERQEGGDVDDQMENQCHLCTLAFNNRGAYLRHMMSTHPSKKFNMPSTRPKPSKPSESSQPPTTYVEFDSAESLRGQVEYLVTHTAPPVNGYRPVDMNDVEKISHLINEEDCNHLKAGVSTECSKCGLVFESADDLGNHLKWGHRKRFSCRGCLQDFNTRMEVKRHKAECRVSMEVFRPRQCIVCGKYVKQMRQHMRRHRIRGDFVEQLAKVAVEIGSDKEDGVGGDDGAGYETVANGGDDASSVPADGESACHTTNAATAAVGARRQARTSGGVCPVCHKFVPHRLQRHVDAHARRGHTTCPICRKRFSRHDVLDAHIKRVHVRERNFVCGQCGKTFVSLFSMQRHQMLHTGAFRYFCRRCHAGFRQKTQLVMHTKRRHGGESQYSEQLMVDAHDASSLIDLVESSAAAAGDQGIAPAFSSHYVGADTSLDIDSAELRFMCQECGAGFSQRRALTTHMRRQHGIENVVFEDVQLRVASETVDPSLLTVEDGVAVGSVVLASSAQQPASHVPTGSSVLVTHDLPVTDSIDAQHHPQPQQHESAEMAEGGQEVVEGDEAVFVGTVSDHCADAVHPTVFTVSSNAGQSSPVGPLHEHKQHLSAEQAVMMVQETAVVTTEQWW